MAPSSPAWSPSSRSELTVSVKSDAIPSGTVPGGIFSVRDRLAALAFRTLLASVRVVDRPRLPEGSAILACWHRDLLPMFAAFHDEPALALVSPSRDADLLTALLTGTAVQVVRGSDSRQPQAVRHLLRHLRAGGKVIMALDGPRGPAGIEKPGIAWLQQRSGAPLWHLDFDVHSALRLKDWSRLVLPLPFALAKVRHRLSFPSMHAMSATDGRS